MNTLTASDKNCRQQENKSIDFQLKTWVIHLSIFHISDIIFIDSLQTKKHLI